MSPLRPTTIATKLMALLLSAAIGLQAAWVETAGCGEMAGSVAPPGHKTSTSRTSERTSSRACCRVSKCCGCCPTRQRGGASAFRCPCVAPADAPLPNPQEESVPNGRPTLAADLASPGIAEIADRPASCALRTAHRHVATLDRGANVLYCVWRT